jgi:FkbM family methyltransferase
VSSTERAPDVTVVLPVFDALPELTGCLDSLLAQDIGPDRFVVQAVDDGSTDGSGAVLDEYAAQHRNVRVHHQGNSGWPGRPRNVGLDLAGTDYVFFMDADDRLGPEALRRMVERARRTGNDVVVPRVILEDLGRDLSTAWRRDSDDAALTTALRALGPMKLFRREFLVDRGLRFPEGRCALEDGIFVSRAYPMANRISVAADYPYYVKVSRASGSNISYAPKEPASYVASLRTIVGNVRELAPDRAEDVAAQMYRNKGLTRLASPRADFLPAQTVAAWVRELSRFAADEVPPHRDLSVVRPSVRLLAGSVRTGDVAAVRAALAANDARRLPLAGGADGRLVVALPGTEHVLPADGLVERVRVLAELDPATPATVDLTVLVPHRGEETTVTLDARWELVARDPTRDGNGAWVLPLPDLRTGHARLDLGSQAWPPVNGRFDLRLRARGADGATLLRRPIDVAPPAAGQPPADPPGRRPVATFTEHDGQLRLRTQWRAVRRRGAAAAPAPAPSRPPAGRGRRPAELVRSLALRAAQRAGVTVQHVFPGTVVVSRRRAPVLTPLDASRALLSRRRRSTVETGRAWLVDDGGLAPLRDAKAHVELVALQEVLHVLRLHRVSCVVDVGANRGQFARRLRTAGYAGRIASFEPVPRVFAELAAAAAADPDWQVHNLALGSADGELTMHVDPGTGTLSSLLPTTDYARRRWARRMPTTDEATVPVRRLAELMPTLVAGLDHPRVYLKLDTQGFDVEAFLGTGDALDLVVAMQSEVSSVALYEGMPDLAEALAVYRSHGFDLSGCWPVTMERATHRALEFDAVLVRRPT